MGKVKMTKVCTKCGESKPATPEYFGRLYAGRDDRLKNSCIKCVAVYGLSWYNKRRGHQLTRAYKHFDKQRGLEFNLDEEWFNEHIGPAPCYYCGLKDPKMGLDRLDNALGHTKENCVPCCTICNRVRLDVFSPEEMKEIGAVIRKIKQSRPIQEPGPVKPFGHRK